MNEELISHIEDLGLSNKEAKVYVASLMLGASPVQQIADQAGIKRVTAYVILESLASLGLVSQSTKGKKTYFNAEEPANLRRLLEKREQEVKEQKTSFEQVLPELKGLKSLPKESPNVKFYDSPEGIRSIMGTFLEEHKGEVEDYLFGVSNLNQLYEFFPEFRAQMQNPERMRAGVRSKFIYTSQEGAIMHAGDKLSNRVSRWVPGKDFPLMGDFTVIGSHIVMLSLGGLEADRRHDREHRTGQRPKGDLRTGLGGGREV